MLKDFNSDKILRVGVLVFMVMSLSLFVGYDYGFSKGFSIGADRHVPFGKSMMAMEAMGEMNWQTTESGAEYIILEPGAEQRASESSTVSIRYDSILIRETDSMVDEPWSGKVKERKLIGYDVLTRIGPGGKVLLKVPTNVLQDEPEGTMGFLEINLKEIVE